MAPGEPSTTGTTLRFKVYDTSASNTSDDWRAWNSQPAPSDDEETALERRRRLIAEFLGLLNLIAWLLLGRQSAGRSQIRRERVWRPPRVQCV